jgi:hypothetical protein
VAQHRALLGVLLHDRGNRLANQGVRHRARPLQHRSPACSAWGASPAMNESHVRCAPQ